MTHPSGPTLPRYQEIVHTLLAEVEQGVHKVGARFPTEQELCARFRVSRHTVREALRRLQGMGLLNRRRGAGSVLAARQADGRFHNSISALDELLQYASSTRLEVLSTERLIVDAEQAERLGCRAETQWVRVSALRRAEGASEPFAYTEIYVDAALGDVVRDIGRKQRAVHAMIEETYGLTIAEVFQTIEAIPADANTASRLALPANAPVLLIGRRYFAEDGRLVEISVNTHPGGRFRYEMTLLRR